MQLQRLAVGAGVLAVGIQAAREGLAALGDFFGQRALHDAQPVRIGDHLVGRIDHGHRVFEVEDGGERGFEHQVADAGRVALADGRAAVDADVQVDAVVLQQHRRGRSGIALVADELRGIGEPGAAALQRDDELAVLHAVAGGHLVRAVFERRGLVEHVAREFDDLGAAHGVVALALFGAAGFGDGVGAVERVVQRTPARVGGVQGVARVQDRHHQLRAGLQREFGVDVGRGGLHALGLRQQVADLFQEGAVGRHVGDRAGVLLVPGVELALQAVALGEQGDVLGREVVDDGVEALPEHVAGHAAGGQDLLFDEAVQFGRDLESVGGGAVGHVFLLGERNAKNRKSGGGAAVGRTCPR
ncbi:hypothetical protein D9M68_439110 [compost metagenome]